MATTSANPLLPGPAPAGRWRAMDRVVAVAFVVVLLVPAGALLAGLRPPEIENRAVRAFPALRLESVLDTTWYSTIDGALTDRLVLRPGAVRLRAALAYAAGGTGTTRVIRGEGDWLFYGLDFIQTCHVPAPEFVASLDALEGRFRAGGQQLRVMIPPDKSSIYPDRFRAGRVPPGCTARNRPPIRAALADRAAFTFDAWRLLEDARHAAPAGPPLYYTQDTHWTPAGAAVAVRALIDTFDPTLWDPAHVVPGDTFAANMDLAAIIGLDATQPGQRILARPGMTVSRTQLPVPAGVDPTSAFELRSSGQDRVVAGRTLVVYDSFFDTPERPFVAADLVAPFFADTVWIRVDVLQDHPELGARFGPYDTVILERVERGVYNVPLESFLGPLVRS